MKKIVTGLRLLTQAVAGNPTGRHGARHTLLSKGAEAMGFRLYNGYLRWWKDPEYSQAWRRFPESDSAVHDRRFTLYSLARAIRSVPGDTVECGVFRGAGSHMILSANQGCGKAHHVFDSFEGLSEPQAADAVDRDYSYSWKKHDLAVTEDIVRANLSSFDDVHLYKGWIPDRFADFLGTDVSLLHIDVDLFEPTLDSLTFFYPRIRSGGVIICDDYGSETCLGAFKAMNEFFKDKPEDVIHLTTGQGVVFKR